MEVINRLSLFLIITALSGIFTIATARPTVKDRDYHTAIVLAEKKFRTLKVKRSYYKLIDMENNILKNGYSWKFTYLSNNCISKDGLRNCLGGEIFIEVNVKSKEATVHFGE